MTVRLDPPTGGHENMAADIELLSRASEGQAGIRVYSWDRAWVTLGRYQNPERDLIADIPWIIRPTGGKGVLHGHDVTVGIAMPLTSVEGERRSIKPVYRILIAPLVDALRACGIPAALGATVHERSGGPRTADCFAFTSENDIVSLATGEKICGCALKISERAALLQASIPVREPLVDPRAVFPFAAPAHIGAPELGVDQLGEAFRAVLGVPLSSALH